jgi:uncharacterized protein
MAVMIQKWEQLFLDYCNQIIHCEEDASHDVGHFTRVAWVAQQIAAIEQKPADPLVLLAAAYFHDIVSLPKNHPDAHLSSKLAAEKATDVLTQLQFPSSKLQAVYHAIHAHSFSAKVEPETLEAQIIQDADRIEALGALGILRVFYLSGRLGTQPYHDEDPFANQRPLDDNYFALDHFYCKLFKLPYQLKTKGGRKMAGKRAMFLQRFVDEMAQDMAKKKGGALWLAWACHQTGQNKQRLFDMRDPFAFHRKRQPEFYLVDQALELKEDFLFIEMFLDELQEELICRLLS